MSVVAVAPAVAVVVRRPSMFGSNCLTKRALPRPAASDSLFITIIVQIPLVQILNLLIGFVLLALEYPAPFLKGSAIHRSFPIRIVLLLLQTFFAILYYQVRSLPELRVLVRVLTPLACVHHREPTGRYIPS